MSKNVIIPADAAPNGYVPHPYEKELGVAHEYVKAAAESEDGWTLLGTTKEGVKKEIKNVPGDSSAIPLARGTGIIEGRTPLDLLSVVTQPGARKNWDPRFIESGPLERYARRSFMFYALQKGALLVQPRDFVGVQNMYEDDDGTLTIVQCSIPNPPIAPDVSGRTRGWMTATGWRLRPLPDGKGTELRYMVKVDPRGSIPTAIVKSVVQDIPQCVANVVQWVSTEGLIPYLSNPSLHSSMRFERYDHKDRAYFLGLIAPSLEASPGGEVLEFKVDEETKYNGGYEVIIDGEAKDRVAVEKLVGTGILKLSIQPEAAGQKFDIIIRPLGSRGAAR
ncbi:Bet v1-like protein [Clavulina sp. PMI_390]|nr:Bet v1-like protein [Clavulina sp. PMI_390]